MVPVSPSANGPKRPSQILSAKRCIAVSNPVSLSHVILTDISVLTSQMALEFCLSYPFRFPRAAKALICLHLINLRGGVLGRYLCNSGMSRERPKLYTLSELQNLTPVMVACQTTRIQLRHWGTDTWSWYYFQNYGSSFNWASSLRVWLITASISLAYSFWELSRRADIVEVPCWTRLGQAWLSLHSQNFLQKLPYHRGFIKEGERPFCRACFEYWHHL